VSRAQAAHPIEPGIVLTFDNGGEIHIVWTDEKWIGFATYMPWLDEPVLRRMTPEDFAWSLDHTPASIVERIAPDVEH
jgi:hypothetical protein